MFLLSENPSKPRQFSLACNQLSLRSSLLNLAWDGILFLSFVHQKGFYPISQTSLRRPGSGTVDLKQLMVPVAGWEAMFCRRGRSAAGPPQEPTRQAAWGRLGRLGPTFWGGPCCADLSIYRAC